MILTWLSELAIASRLLRVSPVASSIRDLRRSVWSTFLLSSRFTPSGSALSRASLVAASCAARTPSWADRSLSPVAALVSASQIRGPRLRFAECFGCRLKLPRVGGEGPHAVLCRPEARNDFLELMLSAISYPTFAS